MSARIRKFRGANMDIDMASPQEDIAWAQDRCPWNDAENTATHRCAIKNISICPYFRGVEYVDTLLCSYPENRPSLTQS